jgi:hypothetical protein
VSLISLRLSPYTVQDHLKSVFAKLGVHSRRGVAATLFFQHYAPRLQARVPLASDGWFSERAAAP